jgi:hypothetical protein
MRLCNRGFALGLLIALCCHDKASAAAFTGSPNRSAIASSWLDQSICNQSTPLIYVTSYDNPGTVYVFPEDAQPSRVCGIIGVFAWGGAQSFHPWGLFVDQWQNLWVTDPVEQKVYEFAKAQVSPRKILDDPELFKRVGTGGFVAAV